MGEKSGGLWLIVIVVVLAGLLMVGMNIFFPNALTAIQERFDNFLGSDTPKWTPTPTE